jgi:molybdate transport system permease protein
METNHDLEAFNNPSVNVCVRPINNKVFQGIILIMVLLLFGFFLIALSHVVWKGLAGFAQSVSSREIQFAIRLSLFTSFTSTVICLFMALPAAYGLARFKIPGAKFINVILNIPLSLPPLVSGVALLLLFGTTRLGAALAEHGVNFIFSVNGIILAQFFIITPYMVRVLRSTFADINPRLEFVARTLGCSQWQAFYKVTLPLAKNGIVAGLVISWSRAIGEFGCALMVAGATRMVTETLPVALYLNMSVGDLEMAMASATCLIIVSLVSLFTFEMIGMKQDTMSRIN